MSRSYWITAIALGLILFAALGQAQEKAQGEQGQAQTEQRPAQTLPIPLPVDIIENKPEAEARKRRETETRQHEIDDLIAQQGMNSATQAMNQATQRMADYALYSTIFVGVGTLLLIGTLLLTLQANKAAQGGVEQAREAGIHARRQADLQEEAYKRLERPYVMPGEISQIMRGGDTLVSKNEAWYVGCKIGNYGRTPAIIHDILDSFAPTPDNHTSDPSSVFRKRHRDFNVATILSPGKVMSRPFPAIFPAVVECTRKFGRRTVPRIEGHKHVFLVINIKFEDVTGTIRISRFTWRYEGLYGRFLRYGGKAYNYEIEVDEDADQQQST